MKKINFKRSLALLLCALMLASAVIPVGAQDLPVRKNDDVDVADEYDYILNLDFDTISKGTKMAKVFSSAPATANPFGYALSGVLSDNNGSFGIIEKRTDTMKNYLEVSVPSQSNQSWFGMHISLYNKEGKSETIGNSYQVDFDFKWDGVTNTSAIIDGDMLNMLSFRRVSNQPSILLWGTLATKEVDGVKVPDETKFDIYAGSQKIYTLDKGAGFTSFKVLYYDASQTYTVYINNTVIVEAKAVQKYEKNDDGNYVWLYNDLRTASFIDSVYDSDMVTVSREEKKNEYNLSVMFMRNTFSSGKATPFKYGLDSICFRELEAAEGRTVFYENSFEGSVGNLVDGTYGGESYSYNTPAGIKVGTNSTNTNKFLNVAAKSRFNLDDMYQFVQEGNYTFEFDFKGRTDSGEAILCKLYDGITIPAVLQVDNNGKLSFMGQTIPGVIAEDKTSDKWTHVAVSVNVDNSNAGKNDFTASAPSNHLRYRLTCWINGKFVGAYEGQRREFSFSSTTAATFINEYNYTRSLLTEAPDLTGFEKVYSFTRKSGSTITDDVHIYYNSADGTIYQLQYKRADGSFVAGAWGNNKNATGSVMLTKGSRITIGDCIAFFDNASASTLNGSIDNLIWYEGVIPKSFAVNESATSGVVNEVSLYDIIIPSDAYIKAYQKTGGGDQGVLNANQLSSSNMTKKTDNGNYAAIDVDDTNLDVYFDLFTPNVAGKVYSAEMTVKNFNFTSGTAVIMGMRRQPEGGTNEFKSFLVGEPSGEVYFTKNSIKNYLCDENGNRYNLKEDSWKTIKLVFDETGDVPTVTYMVNGQIAYFVQEGFPISAVMKAANVTGVFTSALTDRIGAIDQRIRFFQATKKAFTLDIKNVKCELVEPVAEPWADSAMIDFSDYKSIDELGDQFYRTSGVTLEDGVLKIPAGETFAWIDYNGVLAKSMATNTTSIDGFNVEARIRTSPANTWLMGVAVNKLKANFVYLKEGNFVVSGGLKTPQPVCTLESDGFSDVSATFSSATTASLFVDGTFVGVASYSTTLPANTDIENLAIVFPSNTEIAELYIHADLKRELADRSGRIFKMDPNVFTAKDSGKYGGSGIMDPGPFNTLSTTHSTYASIKTDKDPVSGEEYKYYRFDLQTAGSQKFSDIYLTDYFEDSAVVMEYNLRFIPHKDATASSPSVELAFLRRVDGAGSTSNLGENLLYVTGLGQIKLLNKHVLCDEAGTPITVSQTEWKNLAIIYDSNAGHISCRYDGTIPYYKNDSGEIVLADKVQLSRPELYRMDSYETRLRTVSFPQNFIGTLELKDVELYYVDESEKAEFVGVQVSTSERDIRLVAGLDMLYYGGTGFDIEVYDTEGNLISNETRTVSTDTVYSSITEVVNNVERVVYPRDYGYRYFFTANITKVTSENAVKLVVTPFTTVNGVKTYSSEVTLDVDFSDDNMTKWICDTEHKTVRPMGDHLSGNFTTTEYIDYTNDGALEFNGLNAEFAFAANCEGEVSLDITNSFGEVATNSKFDVYVNGVRTKENVTLEFGHHTLVLAERLAKGTYSFKIVKKSGGDFVRINTMNICGELTTPPALAREGAVDVIVYAPTVGNKYGNVEAYVQASESSGDYYIKYSFTYENKGVNDYDYYNGKSNSQNNKDLYRIVGASLVKKNSDGSFGGSIFDVLATGEISLAASESWKGTHAKDFVGGFHGDENMVFVDFFADGVRIDTTQAGKYEGITHFEMIESTIINRCDTEENDVMLHNQKYLVNTLGIKLEQQVEFLAEDYQPRVDDTYLQMATVYRINTALKSASTVNDDANLIGAYARLLDANGGENLYVDVTADDYDYDPSLTKTVNVNLGQSTTNRYVEYLGNPKGNYSGLYGLVGFVIDDASVKAGNSNLAIRLQQGDNKWYASFVTPSGKSIVPKGEIWNISNSYFFDYNPALYGAN